MSKVTGDVLGQQNLPLASPSMSGRLIRRGNGRSRPPSWSPLVFSWPYARASPCPCRLRRFRLRCRISEFSPWACCLARVAVSPRSRFTWSKACADFRCLAWVPVSAISSGRRVDFSWPIRSWRLSRGGFMSTARDRFGWAALAAVAAEVVLFASGLAWLAVLTRSISLAIKYGLYWFVFAEVIKVLMAAAIAARWQGRTTR